MGFLLPWYEKYKSQLTVLNIQRLRSSDNDLMEQYEICVITQFFAGN